MTDTHRGLPVWANYLLKLLLIMIFPLQFIFTDLTGVFTLPSSGLLFPGSYIYPRITFDASFQFTILFTVLRNFVIGFILAAPAVYYDYKLERVSLERSYWKRGIGFSTIVYFFAVGFMIFYSIFMFTPFAVMPDSFWNLYYKIQMYPTLVIGVFIIYPLVKRQAVITGTPSYLHVHSMKELESIPRLCLSREKMLNGVLWLFLMFAPIVFNYDLNSWYGGLYFSSFLMTYNYGSNWSYYMGVYSTSISGMVSFFGNLPMYAIIFGLNFMFVRDLYRYLRGKITRLRFIGISILSAFFPLVITLGISAPLLFLIPGATLAGFPIPLPLLQLAGIFIARLHTPSVEQTERVWKDDRSRVWWEPEREIQPIQPMQQIQTTPERPNRHRKEMIRVPIIYRILSKVRQLRLRNPLRPEN